VSAINRRSVNRLEGLLSLTLLISLIAFLVISEKQPNEDIVVPVTPYPQVASIHYPKYQKLDSRNRAAYFIFWFEPY
jgi:hypothetical protein